MKFLKNTAVLILSLTAIYLSLFLASCEEEHTHSFGEWTTVTESTCASEGLKKQSCSCGAENSEKIPVLTAHSYIGGDCFVCGYECSHIGFVGTCALCGAETNTYTVTVTDAAGSPIPMTLVTVFRGTIQSGIKFTDANGKATFELIDGKHSFTLETASAGFDYDKNDCVLSADEREKTAVLYDALSDKRVVYSSGEKDAYFISAGKNYKINFSNNEQSYFIFTAERTGIYKFTVTSDVTVKLGYFGNPDYVLQNDVTKAEDRVNEYTILIDIAPKYLSGDQREASKFLLGAIGVSSEGSGVLSIEKIAEHVMTPEDYPWQTYGGTLNPAPYVPENSALPGFTLVDLDITNPNLSIVYNDQDGYYHYMTEDGPVVLMKLDVATKYLAAISEMAETQAFVCYIYNEDGTYKEKLTFQAMLLKYIAACEVDKGGVGAYPLDDHLKKLILDVGNAWGWYNPDKNTNIFGDDSANIVAENAWMFALCYADVQAVSHKITLENEGGEHLVGVNVTVTDDEGVALGTAKTDENGVAVLVFKHLGDCFIVLDEATLSDYTVNEADLKLEGASKTITLTAVNSDGGENLDNYDPYEKYIKYNWNTAKIKIQINENTGSGAFPSAYRRYLAGETLNVTSTDGLISKRNEEAMALSKTEIEYVYIPDGDSRYFWGSAGKSIVSAVFSNGASAPDVFCDSLSDLVAASLNACFYNISKSDVSNNFSFTEDGYKASGKPYGYLLELMSSLSLSASKQYILASEYLLDTVRGLNVIPVNVSLLDGLFENADAARAFHNLVNDGGWTFSALLELSSKISKSDSGKLGFLLDTSDDLSTKALLYSRNFEVFVRTEDKKTGAYSFEFLDTGAGLSQFSEEFKELCGANGVSASDMESGELITRFSDGGVLFGGVVSIGALENEGYKTAMSSGIYIAPIPKSEAKDTYKSTLDSRSCLLAVNARTVRFDAVSAFLDYQTVHSYEIVESFCRYSLLWGNIGASEENKEALALLKDSLAVSFVSVYEEAVEIYFEDIALQERGCTWTSFAYGQGPVTAEMLAENALKRQKYYETLVKIVNSNP